MAGNTTAVRGSEPSVLAILKTELSKENVKKKFAEVLGAKAPQFMASITNVVSGSPLLSKCSPVSIMSSAFVAATYDLPIDPNLGFAALVPYWDGKEKRYNAQYQIMYRGYTQLAIRSGMYREMNCSVVYNDELVSYNPVLSKVVFVEDFTNCTQRFSGNPDDIAGFYASFELLTGYRKEIFMTAKEARAHAAMYSQSYKKDLREKTQKSLWSTNFAAMGLKTAIKRLLSRWGILSIEMQNAVIDDQKVFGRESASYADNLPEIEEEPFQLTGPAEEEQEPEPEAQPEQEQEPKPAEAKKAQKKEPEPKPEPEAAREDFDAFEQQFMDIPEGEDMELPFR